jgi:hypothetical protein
VAARAAHYVARKTFWAGEVRVRAGDIAVAGHPLVAKFPDAFEPMVPRFDLPKEAKAHPRSEAAVRIGERR